MKLKFKRASALVYLFSFSVCLFLVTFCSTVSSVDFSSLLKTSEVQETQDGRDISSKSYARIDELLDDATPKEYIRRVLSSIHDNHDFEGNDAADVKNCTLVAELLQQMKSVDGSVWIIDNKTLEILGYDPQQLIQCTKAGDRVIFKLGGVQKFKRTLVVSHELELISDSSEKSKTKLEHKNNVSFTCPDSGPFLIVKATNFTANGFIVENCKESAGNGVVVIKTGSSAVFEDIEINNNDNRAIYVEPHSVVSLKNSSFNNDGASRLYGGVIHVASNVSLSIFNSAFIRNSASYGGAIYFHLSNTFKAENLTMSQNNASLYGGAIFLESYNSIEIKNLTLSQNNAHNGGAIWVESNNSIEIENSTLSQNNAHNGGAICVESNNSIEIENSTLSQNTASWYGGVIFLYGNNIVKFENSTMSQNNARYGGAIFLDSDNLIKIENSTISQNNAELGGAICLAYNNSIRIMNSTLSQNNAKAGGAIYLYSDNSIAIKNSTISQNTAFELGGAISSEENLSAIISNSMFTRNKAMWHGGALKLGRGCYINLKNSFMTGNDAKWGGCLYLERSNVAKVSKTYFSNNSASLGGVIYTDIDCDSSIYASNFTTNHAEFGGCLYGVSSSTKVKTSNFWNNSASQFGGCFFIESYIANFEANTFNLNRAKKDGGAIHASSRTLLHLKEDHVVSNSAPSGGGIALVSDSRILCEMCQFWSNKASRGGGVYIESQLIQIVVAQFANSTFLKNIASQYGGKTDSLIKGYPNTCVVGGMVIKTFGSRRYDCANANEPCSRVLLVNTSFVGNIANCSGSAILATVPKNVLVSCQGSRYFDITRFALVSTITRLQKYWRLEMINKSSSPCEGWKDNRLTRGADEQVIGTFGQRINITINSTDGSKILGDSKFGFALHNVTSGKELPMMKVTTIDAFGNEHAPTLHYDALVLSDRDGFLRQSVSLSFEDDVCIMSSIIGFVKPGNYTLQLRPRYNDDVLKGTNLTIIVRRCTINEVSTLEGKLCSACSEASYNFNLSREEACMPCPVNSDCSTRYITPNDGYWHKSPCHNNVKKCIVEEACNYMNRTQNLTHLFQNFTNCSFPNATLGEYEDLECSEGYKGCLCGSCKKNYGLSSSLKCLECGPVMFSVLWLFLIIAFLFTTTTIAIKGTLPIASRCLTRNVAMPPMHEDPDTMLLEGGTSIQVEEMPQEESGPPPITTNNEQPISSSMSSQVAHGITLAHGNLVETWKILLNFLQVNSTAITMNVKWTSKILGFFKMLNLIGSATLNAISRPVDCLFTSFSIGARAIGRYLFSLCVPLIVIAILSIYWGYCSIAKRGAERWYFWRRLVLTIITVTYVTYFDVTQVAVRVFNYVSVYDNINPFSNSFTRYWIIDTSIECFKSTHIVLICISVAILTTISIGFPIACSIALLRNRNEVNVSNSRAHEVLGLLCGPFKDRFVYWECITMVKKAVLSLTIVFSYSLGNQVQGLLISVILVCFLALHSTCYPFKKEFNILNYYEIGSLTTSCITYTLVELFNVERLSETERGLVSIAVIILNGGFVIFMAFTIARHFVAFAKASLKSYHIIDVDDEISWFKTIRIYFSSWWYGRISSTQN